MRIDIRTLTDGGQTAETVAGWIVEFLDGARDTLDCALYDVRLPGPVGDSVAGALRRAHDRGVKVRVLFNWDDVSWHERTKLIPPPPRTDPEILAALPVDVRAIPGEPDLMHHKYVVRDGEALWTGSMNWTLDSFTRQENVLATVQSEGVAAAFARNFEELWRTERVDRTGDWDSPPVDRIRPWFTPGRGPQLSHRIAERIGEARRRVRIASPVLTAAPVMATLRERLAEGRLDIRGVSDGTQVAQVFDQWRNNPASRWKGPLLAEVLQRAEWSGKPSTPYAPDTVHDYMHAKVTVADDVTFMGSFNLSRSGEMNAENVLEIRDRAIADEMAAFIDAIRERYPAIGVPSNFA